MSLSWLLVRDLTHGTTEKLMKKLRGENDIETILQRLDRLTLDESRATAAQTLEVVYGLVRNRKVVMDGEFYWSCSSLVAERPYSDGNGSGESILGALGAFQTEIFSDSGGCSI